MLSKKSSLAKRNTIEGSSIRRLSKPDTSYLKPGTQNSTNKPAKGRHQSAFVRSEDLPPKNLPINKDIFQENRKESLSTSNKPESQAVEPNEPIPVGSSTDNLKDLVGKYLDQLETKAASTTDIRSVRKSILQVINKEESSEKRNASIHLDPTETQSLEKLLVHIEDQSEQVTQSTSGVQKYTALQEIDTLRTWIGELFTKIETGSVPVESQNESGTESAASSVRQSVQDLSTLNQTTKVDTSAIVQEEKTDGKGSNATALDKPRSSTPNVKYSVIAAEQRRSAKKSQQPTGFDRARSSMANTTLDSSAQIPEHRTPDKQRPEEQKTIEAKSPEKTKQKPQKRKKFTELDLYMNKVTPQQFDKSYYQNAVKDFIRKKQDRIKQESEKKSQEEAKALKFRPEISSAKKENNIRPNYKQPLYERLHQYRLQKDIKLEKLRTEHEREKELNESRELTFKPKINRHYFTHEGDGVGTSTSFFGRDPLAILTRDARRSIPADTQMTVEELQNFRPALNLKSQKLAADYIAETSVDIMERFDILSKKKSEKLQLLMEEEQPTFNPTLSPYTQQLFRSKIRQNSVTQLTKSNLSYIAAQEELRDKLNKSQELNNKFPRKKSSTSVSFLGMKRLSMHLL